VDVVVAGGHGKIGLRLLRLLNQDGHRARGLIRNDDQSGALRSAGGEPAVVDLESVPVPDLGIAIQGADAVVFAAGAGPGSGEKRKWTMDYGGAVKLIEAAQHEGIRRYVIVSAMGAADPQATGASGTFGVYLQAKHDADEKVRESGLDYTIVRPGMLTDDQGTGRVSVGERLDRGEVPRDDVASLVLAVLGAENAIGRDFDLVGGETPIDEAVASLESAARRSGSAIPNMLPSRSRNHPPRSPRPPWLG
jgi:nucleoside-diphosphate-sugar epimerase